MLQTLPKLTEKQERCLVFLSNYFFKHRHMPAHREICIELGLSGSSAKTYVEPLTKKGYLARLDLPRGRGRNYELTEIAIEKLQLMGVATDAQLSLLDSTI
ncbi:MAG: DNA-binding MarR family transcriptional regulator [Oceanicoccus sp.]|jgi:DNA-binding MarR family transcriptional regulator